MLADRLPMASYSIERKTDSISLRIGITSAAGDELPVVFGAIPSIDDDGVFHFQNQAVVVVPFSETEQLEAISCCGDQLLEFLDARVTAAPERFFTDESTVTSWIPLSDWVSEFFLEQSQVLDDWNALARMTHLNRIKIADMADVAPTVQLGKACPIETPEGPNIGRVLTIAQGAVIENGTVRVIGEEADAILGPVASMIPFIERSDPARTLMGANMMRQWIPPLEPELPIVVTGNEPVGLEFANGYNLLTAFVSLGIPTCEDGIVLSRSAVRRMRYDTDIAVGDKFSNRNGTKGVISEIRADEHMPRMSDGTPVDLVFGAAGLHTRMNTGQLFEAVAGRIARATGHPYTAAPCASPPRSQMKQDLADHALPTDGLEPLSMPGQDEPVRSLAGWIYWGRTKHIVSEKIKTWTEPGTGQRTGAMEYWVLRDAGCHNIITETIGVRSSDGANAATLIERISNGDTSKLTGESNPLRTLKSVLERSGIEVGTDNHMLSFRWSQEKGYELARSVKHPWSTGHLISSLHEDGIPGAVKSENERLKQLMGSNAPDSIVSKSHGRLSTLISDHIDSLLSQSVNACLPTGRSLLSGRSVIVPSSTLGYDEIGIPEEMARSLFEPFLRGENCATDSEALRAFLAETWIIINRAPSINETSIIGFRPVVVPHQSIELNPLFCRWLNGDFDGDQIAVYALISDAAREEAAQLLSAVGQVTRDPSRIDYLVPPHESIWGIIELYRQESGREQIEKVLGVEVESTDETLRFDEIMNAVRTCFARFTEADAVGRLDSLMRLGFDASIRCSSMSPFAESPVAAEEADDIAAEQYASTVDIDDPLIGSQLLYARSGIRGSVDNFVRLTKCRRTGSNGLFDGLSSDELGMLALEVRRHMTGFVGDLSGLSSKHNDEHLSRSNTVLARAARAARPGVVFGSAADREEIDPLTDIDARLFVGQRP